MDNEPTILIVDDDPNLTKTLSDIVRLQGYRPLAAAKGKTALDRLNGEMPAVALIDLKLPDMDGLEVMREIKKRSPGTECIVLTGYGSQASAVEAVNLGAYGYMQKPYDVEQLMLTIRRAVEKRGAEEEIRQKTADLTLINSLNNAINRGDTLQAVIQPLSRETKKIFSSSGATIYLLSEDKEHLVMQNLSLPPKMVGGIEKLIGMKIPEIRIPLKAGSLYRQALQAGQPQLINDRATIQSLMAEFTENKTLKKLVPNIYGILGIRSVINVPLVSDGEAIGLLDISSREPFAESDLHRLETISGQFTVAIRRKRAEEATQVAYAELDQIFSTTADGMRVVDKDFNVLRVNETFSTLCGMGKDETVGAKCYEVFRGPACHTSNCPLTRILGGEERVEYDVEKERSDGTRIPCIVMATPFRGPGGELIGIVEDFKDITERKRAQREIEERRLYLEGLVTAAPDAIVTLDSRLRIVEWNPGAERLFGYSREEAIGRDVDDLIANPDTYEEMLGFTQTVMSGKNVGPVETVRYRKDGSPADVIVAGSPIVVGDELVGVVAVYTDITERKRAEEALQESHESYKELADSITDIFFAMDKDLRYTYWNKASENLSGISAEDALGKSLYELFPDTPATRRAEKVYLDVLRTQQPQAFVNEYELGGKDFVFEITAYPSRDGISVFVKDITERKRAEEALRLSEVRFRSLVEQTTDAVFCYEYDPPIPTDLPVEEQLALFYRGILVECNDACARSYGARRAGEVIGGKLTELFGTSPASLDDFFRAFIENGYRTTDLEATEVLDDGTERYHLNNGHGVVEDGMLIRVWGTFRDITEHKRAEEALRESEENFRSLAEQSPNMIFINKKGGVVYANDKSEEVMGYTREEFYSPDFDFLTLIAPESREIVKSAFAKHKRGEEVEPYEYTLITKDGKRIEAIIATRLIDYEGERAILGIVTDITERKRAEEQIEHLQEYLQLQIDRLPIGLIVWDTEFQVQSWNPAAEKIFGFTAQEALGKHPYDLIVPKEAQPHVDDIWHRLLKGDMTAYSMNENTAKDGRTIFCDWANTPLKEADGTVVGVLSMVQDITERKRAEETLRESEERFRTIVETAPSVLLITDAKGNNLYVSPNCEEIAGYTQEDLQGRTVWWVHEDDTPRVKEVYDRTFRDGVGCKGLEYKAVKKNGESWYGSSSWEPLIDGEGKVQGVVFQTVDITERKRAEEALKESEEKFRSLAEQSPNMIFINKKGRVVYANERCEQITGYTREELYSPDFDFLTLIAPESTEVVKSAFAKHMKGEEVEPYEYTLVTKDGTRIEVIHTTRLIEYGGERAILAIETDITERKRAEEEIRKFKTISDRAGYGVALSDLEGDLLYLNESFAQMHGYRADELIGKNLSVLHSEEQLKDVNRLKDKLRQEGSYVGEEVWRITKDDTVFPTLMNGTLIRDEKGNPLFMAATAIDITERKRAEEALHRSLEETARGQRLLLALSQAAQAVERARTPEEVYQTVGDEITRLGYHATIFTLTDDREHLAVSHLTFEPAPLRAAEKLAGLSAQNYRFPLVPGGFFQQIVAEGKTTFTEPMAHHMAEALPEPIRPLASRVAAMLGLEQSIIAPLTVDAETHGVLTVTGSGLTEADVPAVTAFASQAAIALENARLFQETTTRYRQLSALQEINATLRSALPVSEVLDTIAQETAEGLGIADLLILSPDETGQHLELGAASRGRREEVSRKVTKRATEAFTLPLTERENAIVKAYHTGEIQRVSAEEPYLLTRGVRPRVSNRAAKLIARLMGTPEALCVPLPFGDRVVGVMLAFAVAEATQEQLELLSAIADQAGLAIENARLYGDIRTELTHRKRAEEELQHTLEKLRKALGGIIQALALTVETRDPYTAGHQRRATNLARAIATEMGLSEEQIDGIRMAGVVHDLGKISVPAGILNKPGRLTENEFAIIQTHPQVACDILKTIEFPWPVPQIVLQHHERMDGSGYPKGLVGEDILVEARILAVADVVEAMCSHRPYRPAHSIDEALGEIRQNKGVLYDPEVVDACLSLFRDEGFELEHA